MRKVFVYRLQFNPQANPKASQALRGHYDNQSIVCVTPFGVLSCLLTDKTAKEIYDILVAADIEADFIVGEMDKQDRMIAQFSYTRPVDTTTIHFRIDAMSEAERQTQLDLLLDKIQTGGRESLSADEKAMLDRLSQL